MKQLGDRVHHAIAGHCHDRQRPAAGWREQRNADEPDWSVRAAAAKTFDCHVFPIPFTPVHGDTPMARQVKKVVSKKIVLKKTAAGKPAAQAVRKPAVKKPAVKNVTKTVVKVKAGAASDWVEEGSQAPDFTLPTHDGTKLKLSSLKGTPVVLYFYPKDDTPGCTREACGFRDAKAKLAKHKAVVLGISPDSPKSHEQFRKKYKLSFTLLADEGHAVAEQFGAWREKNMYGKKSMGIARSTFIIDAAGKVAKVFKAVNVDEHDEQVLEALAAL
jgi:peroxiredoxin Q/BCP